MYLWEPFFLTTREFELKICKKILIFINIHILEKFFTFLFSNPNSGAETVALFLMFYDTQFIQFVKISSLFVCLVLFVVFFFLEPCAH